jgi:L-fucose mutarotase
LPAKLSVLQKIARSFSLECIIRNFICRTPTNEGNCRSRVAPPINAYAGPHPWALLIETNTMLKNLSPLHTPELLHTLASMGHGDDLAIVDAHFPAVSMAKRLIRLDGVDAPAALEACLRLIPLDTFVDDPASRMEVVDDPDHIPEVQRQFQKVIDQEEGKHWPLAKIERHAFYERAKRAYAIVVTGELRPYGCVLIKKGVVLNR